jgi:hypothetical protein
MTVSTVWTAFSYYWEAPTAFFDTERNIMIHIGLSMPNSLFKLVIYPQMDINGLEQWEELFSVDGSIIWCNGQATRKDTMIKTINNPILMNMLPSLESAIIASHCLVKDAIYRLKIQDGFCIRHEETHDILLNIPTPLLKYV